MKPRFFYGICGGLGVFIYDIRSDGITEEALLGESFDKAEWVPLHGETVSQSYLLWGNFKIDLADFCGV